MPGRARPAGGVLGLGFEAEAASGERVGEKLEMLRGNQRERLTLVSKAPGTIRDTALFALTVEAAPADWSAELPAQG